MKDKPTEWVSISDLMAGVVAVVMLLLVVAVMQNKYAEIKRKREIEQSSEVKRKQVTNMLSELKNSFETGGNSSLVTFDITAGKITLRDNVFARGSACITPEAKTAFATVQSKITRFLLDVKGGQIFVEGHTDNQAVKNPVVDFQKFCTVYDDNYTLSAARAREARKLMIGGLDELSAKNIVVAGYGDSHLVQGIPPDDARNRRVEVRFVVPEINQVH
jgi:chemotaxis protein MotB